MQFAYLGFETRVYPAYMDASTGLPLTADPGGSYDMTPAGGISIPVPPRDGRWEVPEDDPPGEADLAGGPDVGGDAGEGGEPPAGEPPAGDDGQVPPPLMTGTDTEEN